MVNPNWILVMWGTITMIIVGMLFAPIIPEADAILPIKGYVSEAKKKAEAEANATATANATTPTLEKLVETVIEAVLPEKKTKIEFSGVSQIIGVQLSRNCMTMHKYNLTTICPTYNDLLQFDNTIKSITGIFNVTDGVYQRQPSNYKNHCNYYHPAAYPIIIIIDPDGCWQREKGIRLITIQSISPEKMLYKLTANSEVAEQIRQLSKDQRKYFEEESELEDIVDSLEDKIDRHEILIIGLEDDIDELDADDPPLKTRNLKSQLKNARDKLVDYEKDLIEEEADLNSVSNKLESIRNQLEIIKVESLSTTVINGTLNMGMGRYVKECRDATVGSDMQLIADTISYLMSKCKDTLYDSRMTTYIEQTPVNLMDHKFYQFKKWQKEAMERCKELC